MLAVERPLLNMLGRLSGIASLTRRYVDAVQRHAGRRFTIRGRQLPAGGRWRSTPFAAGAGETIVRASSKPY